MAADASGQSGHKHKAGNGGEHFKNTQLSILCRGDQGFEKRKNRKNTLLLKAERKMNMIFEKTYTAANEFDAAMTAAQETFQSAKKEINATFKSPTAETKIAEVKAVYESTVADQRRKVREAVAADMADTRRKVNEFVSVAPPADFAATLAALQAKGEHISDYESRAFLDKYRGNYLAFTTLADVLHGAHKAVDVLPVTPDEIEEEISQLERMVLNWTQNYTGGEYMTALLTDINHTPILKSGAAVQSFIDGDFVISGDSKAVAAAIARMNG